MNKRVLWVIFAVILLFSNNLVFAEEKLTLKDSIKTALENNNELKALKNSLSASEKDIGIAKSNLMPKIKLEESFVSTNNPAQAFGLKLNQTRFTNQDLAGAPNSFNKPGVINNFQTSVALEQPIFVKKANIGIDMAKKQYSAQGYEYLRRQEELVNKLAQTYLSINTAKEFVNVAKKSVNDAKEHLRISQIRYNNGLGLYSDILRAQTALTEAEQNVVSTQKNLNIAKRTLGLLLGKQEQVDIQGNIPEIILKTIDEYNSFYLSRNDIKAFEIKVENAKNGIRMADADLYPTIGLGASYNLFDHRAPFAFEGHNYTAGAFLRWDAFDGNKRKYEKLKAKDQLAEVQEYLEGFKKAVGYKVFESYQNVEEAKKNIELSESALKTSKEGKRLVFKRYENGLSNFVDLLDAQINLDKARANVVKTHNDYKSALINLNFESGILVKELNIE